MRTWTEPAGRESSSHVEVGGVKFCALPHQPYLSEKRDRHYVSLCQSIGMRPKPERGCGGVWIVNKWYHVPGNSGRSEHRGQWRVWVEEGKEDEARREAFELAAKELTRD